LNINSKPALTAVEGWALAAAACAFCLVAILNCGGYRFGIGDQAFYLPAVTQHLNPDLFPRDRAILQRVVAERFVDEGGTFSANTQLMTIVELDPIVGVVFVPERDYARLAVGQLATLVTDAHPGRTFEGRVTRIAPVFRRATRQARIELQVDNADEALKPGMFVRATIVLERVEDALVVPFDALTERAGEVGVFVLDASDERVRWRAVEVGVREGERVQVLGDGLAGRVVTLGQELCDDGARVAATDRSSPAARDAPAAPRAGTPPTR
jgi:multidrug efflux pump subunit AcrA (membrane-fusion protein)